MSAPQPRQPPLRTWVPLSCWAEDLVGGRGAGRTAVSWLVLVLLTGMAFVAGLGPALLLALGCAVVFALVAALSLRHRRLTAQPSGEPAPQTVT